MADENYIEIACSSKSGFGQNLPKRRISLPIEKRIHSSHAPVSGAALIISVISVAFISFIAIVSLIEYDRSGYCQVGIKYKSKRASGIDCAPHLAGLFLISIVGIFGINAWRRKAAIEREWLRRPPPHLIINKNAFWHVDLETPIPFECVTQANYSKKWVTLYCNKDVVNPAFAKFGAWGNKRVFRFDASLFVTDAAADEKGRDWLDALLFLAKRREGV